MIPTTIIPMMAAPFTNMTDKEGPARNTPSGIKLPERPAYPTDSLAELAQEDDGDK
jgi:hypothetical protein